MNCSIFALELCARFEPGGRLHTQLLGLLRNHPANANLQQKWHFCRQAASELLVALPIVERGCWDYFDDDARARHDYAQWVRGMTTEEGARTTPSGDDPYRGGPRYMTFTMAFLLVNGSHTDLALRRVCEIPEQRLWHRETFRHILSNLGVLNFAGIQSDVAYMIPRDAGWGLTLEDLQLPKFHYLRPLV
ncbi:hypothetical protein AKJ09_09954 [Labilithrix luteola]|uniref:Uncharacterized protein n=1 Tax=Labilithrix luteola TaxID=1391654 RepID=A0A0K1QBY9_9BACT|nr:hypothetical protein [Labilithrix luteola]AKV03291.1 hypothetical protein AKJ09_09954 [Labilithrix luteola]